MVYNARLKTPDRGTGRKKYSREEKDIFYGHSEKVPLPGDLGGTSISPFSAGAFCSSFHRKKAASGKWSGRWADQRAAVLGMVHNQYDKQNFSNLSFLHKKERKNHHFFVLKNISSRHPGQVFLYMSAHRFICVMINLTKYHQETLSSPLWGLLFQLSRVNR